MVGVTVIGSINLDLVVACARLPRPGETVVGRTLSRHLGGKGANQAVAASRVADRVAFYSAIGADESGSYLREQLKLLGLADAKFFVEPSAPTGTALIAVDDAGGNSIVIVPGANDCWPEDAALGLAEPTTCVAQFEIPHATIGRFFSRNRSLGGRNILNPAPFTPIPRDLFSLLDCLILNETEYMQFRGLAADSPLSAIRQDLKNSEAPIPIIVTVGDQGVVFKLRELSGRMGAHSVKAVDSTGAGDCFVGVYAGMVLQGRPEIEAIRLANAAAALSVTRPGAASSMPTLLEIQEFVKSQGQEHMIIEEL